MASSNKFAKEAFVSNLEGSSPLELLLISSTVPLGLYVFQSLVPSAGGLRLYRLDGRRAGLIIIGIEILAFWVPAILCQSVWSFPWMAVYFSAFILFSFYRTNAATTTTTRASSSSIVGTVSQRQERQRVSLGVTIYRAGLLCLTCVAILAVDFSLFPRRLAKTEVYGYGWMDLGAASFCIAAGIVSPLARGNHSTASSIGQRTKLKRIIPVLLMGMLRLVTHKGIDYQEHASEYGVHWNFFFTLAVLTLFSIIAPTTHRPTILVPCFIMVIYEGVALQTYGVQEGIESAPRYCRDVDESSFRILCNLFLANREGILGCLGYGSLYFGSEWIASVAIWSNRVNIWWIVSVLVIFWLTLDSIGSIIVSRRTTNLTFCVWALVVNFIQLASIQTVLWIQTTSLVVPPLLDALNRNGLLAFVIANLMTGLVNLTIDTLNASHALALLVLCLYMAAVAGVAVLLEYVKPFLVGQGKKRV